MDLGIIIMANIQLDCTSTFRQIIAKIGVICITTVVSVFFKGSLILAYTTKKALAGFRPMGIKDALYDACYQ